MTPRIVKSYRRMDRGVVQRMGRIRREKIAPDRVVAAVMERTGLSMSDLAGAARIRRTTYVRHLAMWALHECSMLGPAAVGRMFGQRDHSTVISGINRIERERGLYSEVAADIEAIMRECR